MKCTHHKFPIRILKTAALLTNELMTKGCGNAAIAHSEERARTTSVVPEQLMINVCS